MATYSSLLRLVKQAVGENIGTWGTVLNAGMIDLIDFSNAGTQIITTTGGTTTLTTADGATDQARAAVLEINGTLVANANIVVPNSSKKYWVRNKVTGAFTVGVKTAAGAATLVPQGKAMCLHVDGSDNVVDMVKPHDHVMADVTDAGALATLNQVDTAQIVDGAVTTAKIADVNVTEGKLATDSVTTGKIKDGEVTRPKLSDGAITSVIGRAATTAGPVGDIGAGGISVLARVDGAASLAFLGAGTNDQVLGRFSDALAFGNPPPATVAFAATQRVLGRNSAGAGAGEEASAAQVLAWLGDTRGMLLRRGTSAWESLAKGSFGQTLEADGNDVLWRWFGDHSREWNAGQPKQMPEMATWDASWKVGDALDQNVTAQVATAINLKLPDDVRNAVVTDQGAWVAQVYALNSLVSHNGGYWVATAATTAGQEPGVDAVWVAELLSPGHGQEGTIIASFAASSGAGFVANWTFVGAAPTFEAGLYFIYYRVDRPPSAAPRYVIVAAAGPIA